MAYKSSQKLIFGLTKFRCDIFHGAQGKGKDWWRFTRKNYDIEVLTKGKKQSVVKQNSAQGTVQPLYLEKGIHIYS